MCIIVDANRLGVFLREPPDEDMQPVHNWLNKGGKLIYSTGGRFAKEIRGNQRQRLEDYYTAGKARLIPEVKVNETLRHVQKKLLKSDDEHVIALALAAQVDLLCTDDRNLMQDFKNKQIMGRQGQIYTKSSHKRLLRPDRCP